MAFDIKNLKQLFQTAKGKNEFEFVLTLINYRGMGHTRSTSNLHEWFDAMDFYRVLYEKQESMEGRVRIGLQLYSTFFESSDLYNILGSLARIHLGYRASSYLFFKNMRDDRWLSIGEKTGLIEDVLEEAGYSEVKDFFDKNYNKDLRNAFIHSAYSVFEEHFLVVDGEAICGKNYVNVEEFIYPKIKEILGFYGAFKEQYEGSFNSYAKNKMVVGRMPEEQVITVLGSEQGLKGIVAGGTYIKLGDDQVWTAMNLRFNIPNTEQIFITEETSRYAKKNKKIRDDDRAFLELHDLVVKRNNNTELCNLSIVYAQQADRLRDKARPEGNMYKKVNLYERAMQKYESSKNLSHNWPAIHNKALVKLELARLLKDSSGLRLEAYDDLVDCWKEQPGEDVAYNLAQLVADMKSRGDDHVLARNKVIELLDAKAKEGDSVFSEALEKVKALEV